MGILYVVATPIGNLEDITLRAIRILLTVPLVICEDTRRSGQLLKILRDKYGKDELPERDRTRLISMRDWNEGQSAEKIVQDIMITDAALISDAGTPLLSDPGFKLVRAAKEAGIQVVPVPGPFAAATAVSAAGLPTNKIFFYGFLPKKWELLPETTTVIYESPQRAKATVALILERYQNAEVVVARELTKIHEKFEKGEDFLKIEEKIKGEVTILAYLPVS